MKRLISLLKEHKETTIWASAALAVGFIFGLGAISGIGYLKGHPEFVFRFYKPTPERSLGGPAPNNDIDYDAISPGPFSKQYVAKGGVQFPNISAEAFIVGDINTGQIIASKNRDEVRPIASLTKLMTALVADETLGIKEETVVSRSAVNTYGRAGSLSVGDQFTIEELFYPLLLESSNDAAEAIAEHENRYTFLLDMNAKAAELGMTNTSYDDASGLSAKNVSSVEDLFTLVQYIEKYRSYILDITAEKRMSARGQTWYTSMRLSSYRDYVGGKNGYTDEAGKTNIGIFRLPLEGEDRYRDIAVIVFDSRDIEDDTRTIVRYLNKHVYYE